MWACDLGGEARRAVRALAAHQRLVRGRVGQPLGKRRRVDLGVELQAEGALAAGQRLHGAARRAREHRGTGGRPHHLGRMPLQEAAARRQAREQRMAPPGVVQRDLEDADLGHRRRPHLAAQRIRQQLVAEADAEVGQGARQHRLADRRLLGAQPGVLRLLPDVHRRRPSPAARRSRRDPGSPRPRRARPHPRDAVGTQQLAEDAGMAHAHVLQDEDPRSTSGHGRASFWAGRPGGAGPTDSLTPAPERKLKKKPSGGTLVRLR